MCRWLSYRGDPVFLEEYLFDQDHSLIVQSLQARKAVTTTNGDGFGVGWYGTRPEPGLFREILPAWNDSNLKTLAHHIESSLFFAHVRASTGTATTRSNCHPFALGRWMFMHNGQIGGFERIRRRFENALSDDMYRHRGGTTDSEAMFLHFMEGLNDNGPKESLEAMIRRVLDLLERDGIDDPFRMTVAISDGATLYAARYSTDDRPPSLYYRQRSNDVLVVSEPLDDRHHSWVMLPPGSFLACDAAGDITVKALSV